jgi:hypothetical protein
MLIIENGLVRVPNGPTIKVAEISSLEIRGTALGCLWFIGAFLLLPVSCICYIPALQGAPNVDTSTSTTIAFILFAVFMAMMYAGEALMPSKLICNVQGRRTLIGVRRRGVLKQWKEQIETAMRSGVQ